MRLARLRRRVRQRLTLSCAPKELRSRSLSTRTHATEAGLKDMTALITSLRGALPAKPQNFFRKLFGGA